MPSTRSDRPVATWLLVGVGMLIVQVVLGGITRLTGSGLSITEWDVVTGTLPPLNEVQWTAEFAKYKSTPQYRLLNTDFGLSDFKFIFFWEWFHRFWARLIGVVFLIPFVIFLLQRRFRMEMVVPLVVLFLLGALQGAVGWIMVASGLEGNAVYVAPVRLAMHFLLAMVLIAYAWWYALRLLVDKRHIGSAVRLKRGVWWIVGGLGVQFIFGALIAGYKAAPAAPTWPTINGAWVPANMLNKGARSIVENTTTLHFIHRGLAYSIAILVLVWTLAAFRNRSSRLFARTRWIPLLLVLVQIALGIATVLTSVGIRPARWNAFEWMAQLHQLTALLLLLSLVLAAFLLQRSNKGGLESWKGR